MNEMLRESIFFGAAISLLFYQVGMYIQKKTKFSLANPLLIAVILIIGVLLVLDIDYDTYNNGAKYIQYFLTPVTVSLAVPLYRQLNYIKKYPVAVFVSITMGVFMALGSIYIMSLLFGLGHQDYVSLLPKSITTAIGMGITEQYDGIVPITIIGISITGVMGNVMAEILCKWLRITEPVAKGLAIGTSSHALGTSKALEIGEVEGAMSSLSIVVAGIITVIIVPLFVNLI
ncbi:MAG: LrgB family protein [Lachnospiraceae bacterium]|nr:LrgB family protein [Lachnospiraceae bacterium]